MEELFENSKSKENSNTISDLFQNQNNTNDGNSNISGKIYGENLNRNLYDKKMKEESFSLCDNTLSLSSIVDYINDQINEMIHSSFNEEWPAERVELTLKAILQAGVAELMAYPETPVAIIITEYLDLTKSFYGTPEIKVVNGILDKLAKILREE